MSATPRATPAKTPSLGRRPLLRRRPPGGDPNVLYDCVGMATESSETCANGCKVNNPGVPDECKSRCRAAASAASTPRPARSPRTYSACGQGGSHYGIDYGTAVGTPIYAGMSGTVVGSALGFPNCYNNGCSPDCWNAFNYVKLKADCGDPDNAANDLFIYYLHIDEHRPRRRRRHPPRPGPARRLQRQLRLLLRPAHPHRDRLRAQGQERDPQHLLVRRPRLTLLPLSHGPLSSTLTRSTAPTRAGPPPLAALVTAGPPWRRGARPRARHLRPAWPLWLPGPPLQRAMAAIATFWAAARVLDLARESRSLAPHAPRPHRRHHRHPPALQSVAPSPPRSAARGSASPAWLATSALLALTGARPTALLPLRWALGALFVYALAEAANDLAHAVLAAIGQRSAAPPHPDRRLLAQGVLGRALEPPRQPLAARATSSCRWPAAVARASASPSPSSPAPACTPGSSASPSARRWPRSWPATSSSSPGPAARARAGTLLPAPLFVEPMLRLFASPVHLV
jgi:hypothetical protein